jgi:uncharacterized protein (TIGR02678 family)
VIAEGVRDTELAEYQRAVRTLLMLPLVTTTTPDTTALGRVRRFAVPLAADLDSVAGYRLELAASCARLIRRIDRLDDTQRVRRRDGKPFDRRRYAYLALVLAALGRAGTQVALTELADALRRRASEIAGLGFDPDEYRHRLAFVDVVRHLIDLGALREVEVSTIDYVRDPDAGEALYDLDRDVLHLVYVPPRVIQHVHSTRSLLAAANASSRETRRLQARQQLGRLLLEHPVVYVDDLDPATRSYLTSQGRVLSDDLHRFTGGQLERRAEGLALIDTTGGFSDRRFPAGGTAAQLALLFADAMAAEVAAVDTPRAAVPLAADTLEATVERLDAARPSGPNAVIGTADRSEPAPEVPGVPDDASVDDPPEAPLFTDAWLTDRARSLSATHGRTFAAELRDDPVALAGAAVEVLRAFDLVREVPGGVVARPALARYRDLVVHVAPAPQLSLLDTLGEASEDAAPRSTDPT